MTGLVPAWSWADRPEEAPTVRAIPELDDLTPAWAWGGSTGAGVRVAVIDSGIDNAHPAIAGCVRGYISFSEDADGRVASSEEPHDDAYGHGTACAGIIRRLAPDCELYSVKVLGARLRGQGSAFLAGLRWAIEQRMDVVNLSLGTTRREYADPLYELADRAYFGNTILVTAANNMPTPSYPSLYGTVISVACHGGQNPDEFYYNPAPPVEFLAPGIDVQVAWLDGRHLTVTGNSFAAPHIAGQVARIRARHPGLAPFQVKTILRATARNLRRGAETTTG